MKAYVVNPLAILGALNGYSRPLDRHDFPHGSVPDRAGLFMPGTGELRRHANLTGLAGSGVVGADMNTYGTTQLHPLGTIAVTSDGRVFRYATAGAAALVIGNVLQSAAQIALHLALTSAAQAIGDGPRVPIVVTPGNTAGAANLYAEGFLGVDTTPGNGFTHRISGHAAIVASTAFNLYLYPDDALQIAFTTATRYGLIHNPYKNVIQTPTTNTACIAGVAVSTIPANTTAQNYGWIQTRGPASVLINGTPAITTPVVNSATTAGAVDKWTTAAADVAVTPLGRMMQTGVSTKNNFVFLTID